MTVNPLEKRVDDLAAHIERLQGRIDELSAGMVRMVSEIAPGEAKLAVQVEKLQHRVDELAGGMVRMASEVAPGEDELTAQVERLQHRVDELAGGMVRVAREVAPREEPGAGEEGSVGAGPADIAAWMGSSSILPRISTLCFLLVVALALRTVTDSGIIDAGAGSILGMVYAASLLVTGWLRYGKGSAIAPVFSLSGALLMFSVVVETHSRFGSLPTLPAYLLLIGTGVFMALTGRRAGNAMPMIIGTLGMCLAGAALNFPSSSLHLLALLLFAANVISFRTVDLVHRDWLRWVTFALTGTSVQIWGARLALPLADPDAISPPGAAWFVPAAALFAAFFFATTIVRMISRREERKKTFDYVIPAASAFVFFTAARHVAIPLWGSGLPLGAAGVVAASMNLGVASWMVRGRKLSAQEFNSFTFAAVVLLVLSLSAATGALLVALPFLSLAAFHLASISDRWQSGGTRVISYLLQVFIAMALFGIMVAGESGIPSLVGALAAGTVGVVAFLHYRWCRRHNPPPDSHVFSKIDTRDYSAASLLLVSLAGGFFLFRVVVFELLTALGGAADMANAFSGAQSLLINSAAIVLLLVSYRVRSREVRNVAILVILLGAAKVFLYDLVSVEGLARVFSVFSFGLVAAVASWVLGRWQNIPTVVEEDIPGVTAEKGSGA